MDIIANGTVPLARISMVFVSGGKGLFLWKIVQCYSEGIIGVAASPVFAVPRPFFVFAHDEVGEQSPLTSREGFASLVFGFFLCMFHLFIIFCTNTYS